MGFRIKNIDRCPNCIHHSYNHNKYGCQINNCTCNHTNIEIRYVLNKRKEIIYD